MELGKINSDEITCWVDFGDDGKILLRYISREELADIVKKATKKTWDRKARQWHEEMDGIEANRLLGRIAVCDWQGLTVGGEPLPYSPENCDLLMSRSYEFSDFVNEASIEISNFMAKANDAAKKKSQNIQSGG